MLVCHFAYPFENTQMIFLQDAKINLNLSKMLVRGAHVYAWLIY